MDKHCTTNTRNMRVGANKQPPPRGQRITDVRPVWQPQPRHCDKCGGSQAVKHVTNCKKLCRPCREKRERAYGA